MARVPVASVEEVRKEPSNAEERMKMLHDLHARPLYRFLLRTTFGERQAAQDLLQETLIRAWRHIDELNTAIRTLRPWLFTVARRVAIDAGRARQVRPQESSLTDLTMLATEEDSIDRFVAVQAVRRGLARLSANHREVIFQVYYLGRT